MYASQWFKHVAGGATALFALAVLTVGCGTAPTTTAASTSGTTSAASATATACAALRPRTVAGTVQSVSGNSLLLTNMQGKSVKVTLSSTTRVLRETTIVPTSLQEGGFVAVQVHQNADNTYQATRITVTARNNAVPAQRRLPAGCVGTNRPANRGNRNNANGNGNGNTTGAARGITGTVGQLNGNILTVTEANGSDYTVTVTKDTQIIQFAPATTADLKASLTVTLTGQADGQGVITAQSVMILLPGSLNTNTTTTGG